MRERTDFLTEEEFDGVPGPLPPNRRISALVLCGPSGVGKTTIASQLTSRFPARFKLSVSATTRLPRPGESDGVDYHFVDHNCFEAMIAAGKLLEWAEVHGEYYGTPAKNLSPYGDKAVSEERIPVLDIDVQGARQVVEQIDDVVVIFVAPPPTRWLQRLVGRGTESEEHVARRLRTALDELEAASAASKFVVNEDLEKAVQDVLAITTGKADCAGSPEEFQLRLQQLQEVARSEVERRERKSAQSTKSR